MDFISINEEWILVVLFHPLSLIILHTYGVGPLSIKVSLSHKGKGKEL